MRGGSVRLARRGAGVGAFLEQFIDLEAEILLLIVSEKRGVAGILSLDDALAIDEHQVRHQHPQHRGMLQVLDHGIAESISDGKRRLKLLHEIGDVHLGHVLNSGS
jgi:hypothetical protein